MYKLFDNHPLVVDKYIAKIFKPIINASNTVEKNLIKSFIVVYESIVYPEVTEDICIPILEEASGLNYGNDFKVGYSPERIIQETKFVD